MQLGNLPTSFPHLRLPLFCLMEAAPGVCGSEEQHERELTEDLLDQVRSRAAASDDGGCETRARRARLDGNETWARVHRHRGCAARAAGSNARAFACLVRMHSVCTVLRCGGYNSITKRQRYTARGFTSTVGCRLARGCEAL